MVLDCTIDKMHLIERTRYMLLRGAQMQQMNIFNPNDLIELRLTMTDRTHTLKVSLWLQIRVSQDAHRHFLQCHASSMHYTLAATTPSLTNHFIINLAFYCHLVYNQYQSKSHTVTDVKNYTSGVHT